MQTRRGFTFLETLMVITLMLTLASVGYVATLAVLRWQSLLNDTNLIVSQMALAQAESYSQRHDQSHGVSIISGTIVRFMGDSYALRDPDYDVVLPLSQYVNVSGDTEIVFPLGGLSPDQASLIRLQSSIRTYDVTISSYGVLEVTKWITEP